jgi:hypothetical protein
MIQVGGLYRNIWGVVVMVTSIKKTCVHLDFLDGRGSIGVRPIKGFKEYYTKLTPLEVELL